MRFDYDHYQLLNCEDRECLQGESGRRIKRAESAITDWEVLDTYVIDPRLRRGTFMAMLYLIATPEAISYCGDILERFGELLPITLEGQPGYYLWNNTNQRSDLLDQKLCEYDSGRLAKVVFDPEKLTTPMIFCIPEYPKLNLVLTGLDDDEMDFYARYHQHGLTGLTFKTLWAAQ